MRKKLHPVIMIARVHFNSYDGFIMLRALLIPLLLAILIPVTQHLVQRWLYRHHGADGREQKMSRREAFDLLGLKEGASAQEIDLAWRKLMEKIHPDKGGNPALAARLNEARAILKGKK